MSLMRHYRNFIVKETRILLINDFVSTTRVALNLQESYLKKQGIETLSIPSACFSNTFNLGKPAYLDTTDYLTETLSVFEKFNYTYDGIFIGYVANKTQKDELTQLLQQHRSSLTLIDPIMGDKGQFYKSLDRRMISWYQQLVFHSQLFIPNMTEAQLLLGEHEIKVSLSEAEANDLLNRCRKLNHQSVIITSVIIDGVNAILLYDHRAQEYHKIEYKKIAGVHYGTGDLFSAIVFKELLQGASLKEACICAHQGVNDELINS